MQSLTVVLVTSDRRLAAQLRRMFHELGHTLHVRRPNVEGTADGLVTNPDLTLVDFSDSQTALAAHELLRLANAQSHVGIIPPKKPGIADAVRHAGVRLVVEKPVTTSSLRLALATVPPQDSLDRIEARNLHWLMWLHDDPRDMALCRTVEQVVELAADQVQFGLGFDRIDIALIDDATNMVRDWINTDADGKRYVRGFTEESAAADSELWRLPWLRAISVEGKDFYHSTGAASEASDKLRYLPDGYPEERLIVPLRLGPRLLGWISVDNLLTKKPILPDDMPRLTAFAGGVAAALDKVRLHRAAERRAQEFATLTEVSVAVADMRDPQAVCQMAVDQLVSRFNYELVSVYLLDESHLVCQAQYGYSQPFLLLANQGVIARTVRTGIPQLIQDSSLDPDYLVAETSAVAELCVPILIDDRAVGAINVETDRRGLLDAQALELLVQLARHVAVALRNARFHIESAKHLKRMEWLHSVTRDLARCKNPDEVLRLATDGIERGLGSVASIALVDEHHPALRLCQSSSSPSVDSPGTATSLLPDAPALSYRPLRQLMHDDMDFTFVGNTSDDCPAPLRGTHGHKGKHLLLALRGGSAGDASVTRLLGVVRMDLTDEQSEDSDLVPVAVAVANHIATALERARLLAVERRRAEIAEALERATAAITSTLDTAEILRLVLTNLKEVVRFDSAAMFHFVDGMSSHDENSTGFDKFFIGFREFKISDDPIFFGWFERNQREPDLIPDTRLDPRWQEFYRELPVFANATRCYLGTPLVVDGVIVGALTLANLEPHSFDKLTVAATADFAERLSRALRHARLYQAERSANERLQGVMRLQDEFVATVSHELRTPLTSIMGFSENLISHWHQVDDVRRLASVEKIQRASGRLDLLVRDLLYVSRIDSGSLALKLSQQLVLPLLHQAVEELAIKFPGQTVEVGDELRHASVWVDVDRTVQVIGNVLDNAAKYSPEGSPVTVTWDADGRWGTLSVHDTGPGIKPEDIHKLFRRFSKLDSVTRAGHIGTGLGLYICSQLVDKMGGGIWYEPNRRAGATTGATFRIRLPLTPSSHAVPELAGSQLALRV